MWRDNYLIVFTSHLGLAFENLREMYDSVRVSMGGNESLSNGSYTLPVTEQSEDWTVQKDAEVPCALLFQIPTGILEKPFVPCDRVFRLWTCSFPRESKLPCRGMQMYPLLHRRAQGAPTTQPALGQPYLFEPIARPRHFGGGRLVRHTWEEQMRRVYSGFGPGAFCALVAKPARSTVVRSDVLFFSSSPSVALRIHRPASPFSQYWRNQKILEQKKQLPWSFAETALSRGQKPRRQLAWMETSRWGCHRWPGRCSRSLRKAHRLPSECH